MTADDYKKRVAELELELTAAKQLAMRQAQAIRRLQRESREASNDAATEATWKERQGEDYGSY